MGEGLFNWYDNKVKKEWKLAFLSAFFIGFFIHMFRFVSVMPNHDELFNQYNSQNMVGSGRWFLSVACGISGYFDLPWLIGIMSLLYMALTAVVIAEVFDMKNRLQIILSSGILVSFPAITDTMYFEFTADGYMLAMLMAAVSVAITRIHVLETSKHKLLRFAGAALLLCLVCAVYQAYVSFALFLLLCYAITELLRDRCTVKDFLKWTVMQVLTYVVGLLAYFVTWKLCMHIQGYEATTFRGIDTVGTISVTNIKVGIYTSVVTAIDFFTDGIFENGLTPYACLNSLFVLASVCGGITAIAKNGVYKKRTPFLLIVLCLILLPFVACIWSFVSVDAFYSVRMLQSFSILYILMLDVFVHWIDPRKGDLFAALLALSIFTNGVSANVFYKGMNDCFERSSAAMTELSTRIHMLDDGSIRYIAVVGSTSEYPPYAAYLQEQYRYLGILDPPEFSVVRNRSRIPVFLATFADFSLSYYAENGLEYPVLNFESTEIPAPHDWCVRFPLVTVSQRKDLEEMQEVQNMSNWPAADSVKAIGDVIVVKIGDIAANG